MAKENSENEYKDEGVNKGSIIPKTRSRSILHQVVVKQAEDEFTKTQGSMHLLKGKISELEKATTDSMKSIKLIINGVIDENALQRLSFLALNRSYLLAKDKRMNVSGF